MKSISIFLLLFLSCYFGTEAQQLPFSQADATLPALAYSACAWGDYDHDGDLDLAFTGAEGNNPVTRILRNDNGIFTDLEANVQGLHYGSVEWGDYDSDGDLDLLVTGIDSQGNPYTIIFKNTDGLFADAGCNLPGVMDGQASWGDYNNDGNPDILLVGSSMGRIYRNDGNGQFIDINAQLPNLETAMCCWNDYNNDGKSDVLVCGYAEGTMVSKLYQNNHGIFSEVIISPEPIVGLYGGQAKWADLDNDGDQDLVIAGMDINIEGYFLIYRNDGYDHFTRFSESAANLLNPSIDIGDFDQDGLPDIVLIGSIPGCGGPAVTMLLQNMEFMNFLEVSTLLPGYRMGGVTWGDYNNDGFTDLLLTGIDTFGAPNTGLYLNNLGDTTLIALNTPPSPPQGLNVTMEAEKAILHWNSATDAQTPKNAMSYNISIGTSPGSFDIFSPLSVPATGLRKITAPGNASADTSWIISGIPGGTYYFSVQAIDNGFMPGSFSTPLMFDFTPMGIAAPEQSTFSISPNPCQNRLMIHNGTSATFDLNILIVNELGRTCYQGNNPKEIDISSWSDGIYLVQSTTGKGTQSVKLIKN
ncbi:MAG: FG-GAP-like repeat-containing protein [Bacteroidetes bacterium]|nr:FG-GAP-like repeat-containing protein [Bacteroidota bacterium]